MPAVCKKCYHATKSHETNGKCKVCVWFKEKTNYPDNNECYYPAH